MNKVMLVGRLTKDIEVRYCQTGGTAITHFNLAVERKYKKEGEQQADFINCVAWGKTAEFLDKYFSKGMRVGIEGRIQTGNYTNQDGKKVYTTDVVVEGVEFVESKVRESDSAKAIEEKIPFESIEEAGEDEELPFN